MLKRPLLYEKELENELRLFLTSQFIEALNLKEDAEKKEYFVSIIKKIIFEDMTSFFLSNIQRLYFRLLNT